MIPAHSQTHLTDRPALYFLPFIGAMTWIHGPSPRRVFARLVMYHRVNSSGMYWVSILAFAIIRNANGYDLCFLFFTVFLGFSKDSVVLGRSLWLLSSLSSSNLEPLLIIVARTDETMSSLCCCRTLSICLLVFFHSALIAFCLVHAGFASEDSTDKSSLPI